MAKITSWKLWKMVRVYSNHGNTQSGKSHIQVVGNIMAFLLTLAPLPPPVAQHSLKEATTQFQIPCLQPEGAEWPYMQHSDLSGGCLRDWCLFFLTWSSDREKLHSLDLSLQKTAESVKQCSQKLGTDLQMPGARDYGWRNTVVRPRPWEAGDWLWEIKTF